MKSEALSGGFSDFPIDAARSFRRIMQVMARPGLIEKLDGAAPPAPLSVASGTIALTLCDPETLVYLAGECDTASVRDWLRFHTGASFCGPDQAVFAFGDWQTLLPLKAYAVGTPEYPDRSATLVVELPKLENMGAELSGPGIQKTRALSLPEEAAFQRNQLLFPLGLDFIFTSDAKVAALPRTTKVEAT